MNQDKRLVLNIIWILLGAILIGLTAIGTLDSTVYSGFGGGLIGVGVLQLAKKIKYKTDAEYREKVDIEEKDERNRFIRKTSLAWTGYIAILADAVAVIVAMVLGQQTLMHIFSSSVCFMLCVYLIVYFSLKKKY